MSTIRETLRSIGSSIARADAEILLAHTMNCDRSFVIAHPDTEVPPQQVRRFVEHVARRARHEPVALILRRKEFYGRTFSINRHTLVPRPETELLVERALRTVDEMIVHANDRKIHSPAPSEKNHPTTIAIMDIGTGSGNIITTIAKELERKKFLESASFIATDISNAALRVARKNAAHQGVKKSIRFFQSDMLSKIPRKFLQKQNAYIIVANLPYLSESRYAEAPRDVRDYEPKTALISGSSGLDHIRKLIDEVGNMLKKSKNPNLRGRIILEIDPEQKKDIMRYAPSCLPEASVNFFRDLSGKIRVADIEL